MPYLPRPLVARLPIALLALLLALVIVGCDDDSPAPTAPPPPFAAAFTVDAVSQTANQGWRVEISNRSTTGSGILITSVLGFECRWTLEAAGTFTGCTPPLAEWGASSSGFDRRIRLEVTRSSDGAMDADEQVVTLE